MPSVTRKGDDCTGHGCFPPRPSTGSSGDVFVNGIGVVRQGDGYASHSCGSSSHGSDLADGSGTVNVNDLPAGRIGDPVACGSAVAVGSEDVFFGD